MEQDFKFGDFILKVPRRDWNVSIYKENTLNELAEFCSDTILITVSRLSKSLTTLEDAEKACASKNLSLSLFRTIRTSRSVVGLKVIYRNKEKPHAVREMCYIYPDLQGRFVYFRAKPIARYPDWTEANRLVTGDLRYENKKR
ncbi:MAG: hypothetical protein ABI615_10540 [Chthoniobacterales bacterium]